MKVSMIRKMLIFTIIFSTLLYVGTFLRIDKVYGQPYDQYHTWNGFDLPYQPLNPSAISFESDYLQFSTIMDVADPNTIDQSKTYVIESAFELYRFSVLASGSHDQIYLSLNYALGQNIDYYDALKISIENLFIPIGFNEPFTGTFDGQGYEITNLIFRPTNTVDEYDTYMPGLVYLSMFSKIDTTGVVKNFGLINPLIIQALEQGVMTHVSVVAGENKGLVENVYYIDLREQSSGINAEGNFHISGLVSRNIGTVSNSFVSTPYIKSQAIQSNLSTSTLIYANQGTVNNVYYDSDVLEDNDASTLYGTGLTTNDFQNPLNFNDDWYFRDSYTSLASEPSLESQFIVDNQYPILQGLDVENGELLISDAVDFVYMHQLLGLSGQFRSADYVITHDIDMNQVSKTAYKASNTGFSGTLSSKAILSSDTILYDRLANQGGDITHHSIINLKIEQATYLGNYASYALFSSLFGTVKDINIYNLEILTEDIDETFERTKVLVGAVAGQMNHGTIENVHVDVNAHVVESTENLGQIIIGGFVGEGGGVISQSTTSGNLTSDLQVYNVKSAGSAVAGMVAKANDLSIIESMSMINVKGMSYTADYTGTSYVSGMVGYGTLNEIYKAVFDGTVTAYENGFVDTVYVASMFANILDVYGNIEYVFNAGEMVTHIDQSLSLYQNGIGYFSDLENDLNISSMTNHGMMDINTIGVLSDTVLDDIDVYISGVLTITDTSATLYGIYHDILQNQIDLSLIDTYSGILTNLTDDQIDATKLYQTGHLDLYSQNTLTNDLVQIAGVALGESINFTHIRQTGDIEIYVDHMTNLVTSPRLNVYGVFESLSLGYHAEQIINTGDISVIKDGSVYANYDVYISGILGYHKNEGAIYDDLSISHNSIDITNESGYLDTLLNDGDILVRGDFDGSIRASGIVLYNRSLLTNAINLGDIDIVNNIQTSLDEVEAAGIAYLMSGEYAQLKDAANHGDIRVISNTSLGFAHAAGIAVRNDRLENGSVLVQNTHDNERAKITFSINYGNIFAFSNVNESGYTIVNETRSKAAGIFAIGILSSINNVNYGNVYSKYLASGIIGFIYYNRFGTVNYDEVFISNSMNYGKIRQITAYDSSIDELSYNNTATPPTNTQSGFGAIVGKFHTGTTTWQFVGNVNYPIDRIYFGYLLNFDDQIDMFASAPAPDASNFYDSEELIDTFDGVISGMLANMATTNPNDDSVPPFTEFTILIYIWIFPVERQFGQDIQSYELNDGEDGIFYETFGFRSSRPVFGSTDQYIRDYIQYLPREKVNEPLLDQIEADTSNTFTGIYALSSSSGIGNGIFIPDHFETEGLNIYDEANPTGDSSWLGDSLTPGTISNDLYHLMRQIKSVFATTIYDLEIKQVDSNGDYIEDGLTLTDPVIDEARGLLTYYIPSNALILNGQTPQNLTVSKYVEVSPGITGARYVPNLLGSGEPTYKWVGTHKKVNDQMIPIGPYAELSGTTVYNVVRGNQYYEYQETRLSRLNPPLYQYTNTSGSIGTGVIDEIVDFSGYTVTQIWFWTFYNMEGYRLDQIQTASTGYGAYEQYYESGYTRALYRYIGPNTELVTYVNAGLTPNVTVYPESNVFFKANIDEQTYTISDGASLINDGTAITTNVSIPRSYGIYDQMYDEFGFYIDSVEDHYGTVRVFSEAYDAQDPATYKDYTIRVIRTADQEISDLDILLVNSVSALPGSFNVENVTASQNLFYEYDGTNGYISLTYETFNISDLYYLLPSVEIFDNNTGVKVHTSLYRLEKGYVSTNQGFNNQTGEWGYGNVSIDFIPEDDFPSGDYRIQTTLITGDTYSINFSKLESGNANVLSLVYQGEEITPESNVYTSEIPYGLYYIDGNSQTDFVNFTNLSSIDDIYYLDVPSSLPNYLEGLEISTFSTIDYIDLTITKIEGYRHQYDIIYHLVAENGSTYTFTHRLVERPLYQDVEVAYKNGGELPLPLTVIDIFYEEGPTLRFEYDFNDVFFPNDQILSVSSFFTPLNGTDDATENIDYFISTINGIGFEVDLNKATPKGDYQFMLTYHSEVVLWGYSFDWTFDFTPIDATKLKNDNAYLENILFASNSVFDSVIDAFSTIIEVDPITVADYEGYYVYPIEDRTQRIINVLPTTGIDYGDYQNEVAYWILGQVQRTNLASYTPTFYVPDGAKIYKVIDENNLHYDYQSPELTADYSDFGDGVSFTFVHYRIYAEDFDENPNNYVDYYVTVQDTTNNVKIDITVMNDTTSFIEEVFVTVNVCRVEEGEACDINNYLNQMQLFSYFNQELLVYENLPFATSTDGTYKIDVDLPIGFDFYIEASQDLISGDYLEIPSSRIPQRYFITIHIVEGVVLDKLWGYDETYHYTPVALELDELRTYVVGERFIYNEITYEVQPGYTYLYSVGSEPGTSSSLGLLNTSRVYDPFSTYIDGNTVFHLGTYYKALDVLASGVEPSLTSVSNGLWFEISEVWLSYNHYQIGDMVLYNGEYYTALANHQNIVPDANPLTWELYVE
ncbi:hypothetical protein BK011_03080 [Tenericutes bacterium MZ-XQ]|nr:hypothetical protein BK011_03080 [Tenericutes bacterium MZ-XQ]